VKATTAGKNVAQAMQDGLYGRLLDHRAGDIEQGSIPAIGPRQSFVVFRHAHQTSTTRTVLPYRDTNAQTARHHAQLRAALSCREKAFEVVRGLKT
jgi:hypothetical protein